MTRSDIKCEVTFCAKFAPSTGKAHDRALQLETTDAGGKTHYKGIADLIARRLFPEIKKKPGREKAYRKFLKELREALDVPEIKMCANRWAEIRFAGLFKVTSLCLKRNRAAFFNEEKSRTVLLLAHAEAETGNRHPDNADRIAVPQECTRCCSQGSGGRKGDRPA